MDELDRLYYKLRQVPFEQIEYLQTDVRNKFPTRDQRIKSLLKQGWTVEDFLKTAAEKNCKIPICVLYRLQLRNY